MCFGRFAAITHWREHGFTPSEERILTMDDEILKEQIKDVLAKFPTLNPRGMVIYPKGEKPTALLKPEYLELIKAVMWFLEDVPKTKGIQQTYGSYRWKHTCERWLKANGGPDYIDNGVFIMGAALSGFRVKPIGGDNPNAFFNMSKRELNRKEPNARFEAFG